VYQVKLTAQEAKPDAKGASENIERWVEFVQKGTVKGREVVSIVPQNEVKNVVKDAPPAAKRRTQGPAAERERLPARVVQQGREPLPDLLPSYRSVVVFRKGKGKGTLLPFSFLRSPSRRTVRDAGVCRL
jgi:hypothetical protein